MASPAIGTGTGNVQTASGSSSAESVTITTPTDAVTNDLLVAYVLTATAKTVTSSGWTSVRAGTGDTSACELEVFYRYHDGSSPNYEFAWTGGGNTACMGGMVRVTGAATSSPIDVSAVKTDNSFSASQVAPSVTTTVADTLLLCVFGQIVGAYTYTTPSGMTEVADATGGSSDSCSLHKLDVAATGATGTKTATVSSSTWCVGISLAIKPAPSLIKSVGSVPIASVKKVSGVAIASAKKVAGVANT